MDEFIRLTIFGLVAASIYFVAASGLVLTYTTSGIFNFAHGATGMMAAFVYWELRFNPDGPGLPTLVSLFLVLGVFAPLFGMVVERVLIRNLQGASLATTLVVTVGLLAGLIGLAQTIWPPEQRPFPGFFGDDGFEFLNTFIRWSQAITILIAIGVVVGLRLLLYNTRAGVAMRAVVDNPDLAALNGAAPSRMSSTSWALGSSLAALAGILLAPVISLEIIALTLLVVNAYSAAMVGRLKSLPLTLLGAVILGLLTQYEPSYLPRLFSDDRLPDYLTGLNVSVPVIMLFVVLLLLPAARITGAHGRKSARIKVPSLRTSIIAGGLLVAAALVVSGLLSDQNLRRVGEGLALGIIMLSLVPLTGYAGQVSLCQFMLAGVGAFAMSRLGEHGSVLGLVAAAGLAAVVGAVIALPALRLQGLYLALSTLAVAVLADNMFFTQREVFFSGTIPIGRLDLGFIDFGSDAAYFVLLAVAYALVAILVLSVRRGELGRRLLAMRDSPAACATLGLDLTRTKLTVFALSAAIAGIGGALYGGLKQTVGPTDFQMILGLPILLLAVLGGVATASGALVGGLFFSMLLIISAEVSALDWLVFVGPGLVGVTLGRSPDGVVPAVSARVTALRERFRGRASPEEEREAPSSSRLLDGLGPDLPVGASLSAEQLGALDDALGISALGGGAAGAREHEEVGAGADPRG